MLISSVYNDREWDMYKFRKPPQEQWKGILEGWFIQKRGCFDCL